VLRAYTIELQDELFPRLTQRMSRSRWHSEFGWGIEFGWHEAHAPGPQTEDSLERGFPHATDLDHQGRSDELDPEDVGDMADEGPGRRG
jgi:hypothetical protein